MDKREVGTARSPNIIVTAGAKVPALAFRVSKTAYLRLNAIQDLHQNIFHYVGRIACWSLRAAGDHAGPSRPLGERRYGVEYRAKSSNWLSCVLVEVLVASVPPCHNWGLLPCGNDSRFTASVR